MGHLPPRIWYAYTYILLYIYSIPKHSILHRHACVHACSQSPSSGGVSLASLPCGFLVVAGSPDGLPQLLSEVRSFFFSLSTRIIYLQQTTRFIQYFVFEIGFSLCHSSWLCTSGLKQSSCLSLLSSHAPGCAPLYILHASVDFILSMTPRGRNYYSLNLPDERTAELHALPVPHSSKSRVSFFCAKAVVY